MKEIHTRDDEERRAFHIDPVEFGRLTQAVETLTVEMARMSNSLGQLEHDITKGKGMFIGALLFAGMGGAVLSRLFERMIS